MILKFLVFLLTKVTINLVIVVVLSFLSTFIYEKEILESILPCQFPLGNGNTELNSFNESQNF